jgi:hypothetical protein
VRAQSEIQKHQTLAATENARFMSFVVESHAAFGALFKLYLIARVHEFEAI